MGNISIKLNLRQLKSHVMKLKGKSGMIDCLVLPVEANCLFVGEKGIYLDLYGYEIKERKPDRKQTHIIKQSFPEDVYRLFNDDDKKNLPIVGDAILWGRIEPEPVEYLVEQPPVQPENPGTDDLPF